MENRRTALSLFWARLFLVCLLPCALGDVFNGHEVRLGPPGSFAFRQRYRQSQTAAHLEQLSPRAVVGGSNSDEHVFVYNQQVDFSWDDEKLLATLNAGIGNRPSNQLPKLKKKKRRMRILSKRAGGTAISLNLPTHCLGCKEHTSGQQETIADLDKAFIKDNAIFKGDYPKEMQNSCIFYTGVTVQDLDANRWVHNEPDKRLTARATKLACQNQKQTIWTIWPGEHPNAAAAGKHDDLTARNMFEIDNPGSWLNFLDNNPDRFIYFQRMSTVMAEMASGTVYVLSLNPLEIDRYGTGTDAENNRHSIWNQYELPALQRNLSVNDIYAIYASNPTRGFRLDKASGRVLNRNGIDIPGMYINLPVRKRDIFCTSSAEWETMGEDWFGTGRIITGF